MGAVEYCCCRAALRFLNCQIMKMTNSATMAARTPMAIVVDWEILVDVELLGVPSDDVDALFPNVRVP
jgi:hypothetical protein